MLNVDNKEMNKNTEQKLQLVCVSNSVSTILVKVEKLFHDMLQHVRIDVSHEHTTIHVYHCNTNELLFHCLFSRDEANRADEQVNVYLTFYKGNDAMLYMRMYHAILLKLKQEKELYVKNMLQL